MVMVLLLVLFLSVNALFFTVVVSVISYLLNRTRAIHPTRLTLSIALGLLIAELSTMFVGFDLSFPWLLIGYSMVDTWMAGFASIGGVNLISLMVLIVAVGLYEVVRLKAFSIFLIAAPWLIGAYLLSIDWTQPTDEVRVGLLQSNISAADKLAEADNHEAMLPTEISLYRHAEMTMQIRDVDWIFWPETAIPSPSTDRTINYLRTISELVDAPLIVGMIYLQERQQENVVHSAAVVVRPDDPKIDKYFKQKLVPFGEYVPFHFLFKRIGEALKIPLPIIAHSRVEQPKIELEGKQLGIVICYEIAFPTLVAQAAYGSNIFATISEDGWFGKSIGPHQHMQIARMRAIETGKYFVRTTSSGITGIIDPKGKIISSVPAFEQQVLIQSVPAVKGDTPYVRLMNSVVMQFFDEILISLVGSLAFIAYILQFVFASGSRDDDDHNETASMQQVLRKS